jgi:hypothetical protein
MALEREWRPARARRGPAVVRAQWTRPAWAALAVAAMPGLGVAIYSVFIYWLTGDPFAWVAGQAAWGRNYTSVDALVGERYRYIVGQGIYAYTSSRPIDALNGLGALFGLSAIVPTLRRFGAVYALFIAVNVVPPLFSGVLLSMGRMSSVLFPAFFWLGSVLPARHRPAWIAAFALGQGLCAALFYTWRPLY